MLWDLISSPNVTPEKAREYVQLATNELIKPDSASEEEEYEDYGGEIMQALLERVSELERERSSPTKEAEVDCKLDQEYV